MGSMMSDLAGVMPPSQPFLHALAEDYVEKKVPWNPYCLKQEALMYQFRAAAHLDQVTHVPDACVQILFECDRAAPRALLMGIRLERFECRLKPGCLYFAFKPYTYLGMKPGAVDITKLINTHADLRDVYPAADVLSDMMISAGSFDERVRLMLRYAREYLVDESYTPSLVDYASVAICAAGGNVELGNLDAIMGYSSRYVRGKFKERYGISPKQYSGIMRFQSAVRALLSDDGITLSALASEKGYFDQAHFNHDFKRFAAASPGEFRSMIRAG